MRLLQTERDSLLSYVLQTGDNKPFIALQLCSVNGHFTVHINTIEDFDNVIKGLNIVRDEFNSKLKNVPLSDM